MRYIQYFKDMLAITNEKISTIVWYVVLELAQEGALLLPPIATAGIIGVLTSGGTVDEVLKLAILYIAFYILYTAARLRVYVMYANIAKRFHIMLQRKMFEHVVKNDGIFDDFSKGKIIAACTDDVRWVVDVIDCSAYSIARIVKLIIIFVIFAVNNIWVAIVAVLVDVIYMALMAKNAKSYSKHFDGSRKYEDKATDILNQVISDPKQIKMMGLLPSMLGKYDNATRRWMQQYRARRRDREKMYVLDEWVTYLGKIALYVMMAVFVMNGEMTIEMLVLLISYFEQVVTSTNELWRDGLRALSEYGVQTARVKRILNYTQKSEVLYGDIDNDYITGLVEFKNVGLRNKKKAILKKVSFKAKPNEITAIIGPKGAGKTSIMNLLYRLNRIDSGEILIDGENIYNYSKRAHNSNIAGVFHKPFMLNATIRENLSLVEKNHKKQEEACARTGLNKVIKKLPNGYDTVITEDERVLAEGDKQLLALTRAVLTGAEILVFDEISSVGAQAIPDLAKILEDLKQDHTVIIITHEKDLIAKADRVVEMADGKVVKTFRRRK